jgi:tetratricopeptide (TPR) repeat protein
MSKDLSATIDPFAPTALDEETELRALARALQFSEGFKLIFVRCNQAQQRQKIIAALQTELPGFKVQEIHLTEPVTNLLDELRVRIASPSPDALFVSGLEYSLPTASDAHATPVVANLNASRNSFPGVVPCPLVLWIPEYVLNAIMLGAPDFFSIRSGVYFFASTPGDTSDLATSLTAGDEWMASSLSASEKQERIDAIKSLLADYESLPSDQRDYKTECGLHNRLGTLFSIVGLYPVAQQHYKQSLSLAKMLKDPTWEGIALVGLANIFKAQGGWTEAEQAYQQALAISREAGKHTDEAIVLNNLGYLYGAQRRLAEAEDFFQQSLSIFREAGDRSGESFVLIGLGNIYGLQKRSEEAVDCFQRGLNISREFGVRYNELYALGGLGTAYWKQGRVAEAKASYQQSIDIARTIGDAVIEGLNLYNLGDLYKQEGQLAEAENCYLQSLAIRREVGDNIGWGETLQRLAFLRVQRRDLEGALDLVRQAAEAFKAFGDAQKLAAAQKLLETLESVAEELRKAEAEE